MFCPQRKSTSGVDFASATKEGEDRTFSSPETDRITHQRASCCCEQGTRRRRSQGGPMLFCLCSGFRQSSWNQIELSPSKGYFLARTAFSDATFEARLLCTGNQLKQWRFDPDYLKGKGIEQPRSFRQQSHLITTENLVSPLPFGVTRGDYQPRWLIMFHRRILSVSWQLTAVNSQWSSLETTRWRLRFRLRACVQSCAAVISFISSICFWFCQEGVECSFQREYYTTLLKRWVNTSLEELESIQGTLRNVTMIWWPSFLKDTS